MAPFSAPSLTLKKKTLYCLLTDVEQDAAKNIYREKPYLAAIDLQSAQLRRVLELPAQREIQFNISPDGQSILLNSAISSRDEASNQPSIQENSAASSRSSRTPQVPTQLILLPINISQSVTQNSSQPNVLPMFGNSPRWLP